MLPYPGCNQRVPEYNAWVCLCKGMGIQSYVELGHGSSHFLAQAGVNKVVSVDLLDGELTGVHHFTANSQSADTRDRVLEYLGGQPDCVFIDADHEDAGVRRDFELWWPVARVMVGFHDILMPSVVPFWNDVALRYPSIQIVARDLQSADDWQRGGFHPDGQVGCGGIGVLFRYD